MQVWKRDEIPLCCELFLAFACYIKTWALIYKSCGFNILWGSWKLWPKIDVLVFVFINGVPRIYWKTQLVIVGWCFLFLFSKKQNECLIVWLSETQSSFVFNQKTKYLYFCFSTEKATLQSGNESMWVHNITLQCGNEKRKTFTQSGGNHVCPQKNVQSLKKETWFSCCVQSSQRKLSFTWDNIQTPF